MPKVVLDVVALIFKRIEALILDFPPATPATDQGFDVFRSRLEIGNPAVGIGHFLRAVLLGYDELVLEIIDLDGLGVTVQGDLVDPGIGSDCRERGDFD